MDFAYPKLFLASGAINAEGEHARIVGARVVGLGTDSSVSIYDSTGVQDDKEIWQSKLQPGDVDDMVVPVDLRNGGYVKITGTAKVFVYLA